MQHVASYIVHAKRHAGQLALQVRSQRHVQLLHGKHDLLPIWTCRTVVQAVLLIHVLYSMHSFEVGCSCIIPLDICSFLCVLVCRVSISLTEATTSLQHVDALLAWPGCCDGIVLKWKVRSPSPLKSAPLVARSLTHLARFARTETSTASGGRTAASWVSTSNTNASCHSLKISACTWSPEQCIEVSVSHNFVPMLLRCWQMNSKGRSLSPFAPHMLAACIMQCWALGVKQVLTARSKRCRMYGDIL